jgi:PAS domain S-box-containing protein
MNETLDPHPHDTIDDYLAVLDAIPQQIWFLADERTYGRVNRLHAEFCGRTPAAMEGRPVEQFFAADVVAACRAANRAVFERGATERHEEWRPDATGQPRLLAITRSPKVGRDGRVESVICVAVDVTEGRQAAELLQQSEQNHRAFFTAIDDIVVVSSLQGAIRYANPAATSKLGWTQEELVGMRILDLHPAWARDEATAILQDMFAGRRHSCPLPLQTRADVLLPVETRVWFGRWNGEDCIFGMSKDLSKEQEALQTFDRLFRMNPAPMALSGFADRRFVDVNDAWLRALGYRRDDVLGHTSTELGLFPDQPQQRRVGDLLSERGSIQDVDLVVRTRHGELRHGLFSGEVIQSQGQRLLLTVMIDITERQRAQAEKERVIAELQAAAEQIRTLKGFIPICSVCRKLRDDEGYWAQLEDYLARHTDVRLSHGVCPDCMKSRYNLE